MFAYPHQRSKEELISQNISLIDQVEKYRNTITKLKIEKRFLIEKLSCIDNLDEFEASDNEIDEEPPLKRRKLNSSGKPKRKYNDSGNYQVCIALRKDGTPCKSKASVGSQYCWHHSPTITACEYRDSKNLEKRCKNPGSKDAAFKGLLLCNYHKKKIQTQALLDTNNNLNNTEAQLYLQGIMPGKIKQDNNNKEKTITKTNNTTKPMDIDNKIEETINEIPKITKDEEHINIQ